MQIKTEFISIACNRVPGCLAISPDFSPSHDAISKFIAFGANKSIAVTALLAPPSDYQHYQLATLPAVKATLNGHSGRVNQVKFIHFQSYVGLISACSNGELAFWLPAPHDLFEWSIQAKVTLQSTPSIDYIAVHRLPIAALHTESYPICLIATAGSEERVTIYTLKTLQDKQFCFEWLHTFEFIDKMATCLEFFPLAHDVVLAIALTDNKIHFFSIDKALRLSDKATVVASGHEGWIRSMTCHQEADNSLLLATASQDKYIRTWRIQKHPNLSVNMVSLLIGHDNWIYSISFIAPQAGDEAVRLLSCSADGSILLWQRSSDNLWSTVASLGEINDTFGFYGLAYTWLGDTTLSILAHSHSGSVHAFQVSFTIAQPPVVQTLIGLTGHDGPVQQVSWLQHPMIPSASLLASVSDDMTTRFHAFCPLAASWLEITRPQVHGYDMKAISFMPHSLNFQFVSAGDEKVQLSIFQHLIHDLL
jgi:elongator complex protein 2